MRLRTTQRTVAAALMAPLDRTARSSVVTSAAQMILPNSQLSARERLDIYRRSYWYRLLDSFRDDFPGLAGILGPKRFERLARAYLAACPSESFTLRDLGARLEAWLREHPEFASGKHQLALDMVRLEWAHIAAFDGRAETALAAADCASNPPPRHVGLQPCLSLLHLRHPVDELRIQTNKTEERRAAASNTTLQRGRPPQTGLTRAKPSECYVAVHRVGLSVYYRRLSREEYQLLCALRDGQSIAGAISTAFTGSTIGEEGIPQLLRAWFSAWATLGWLTARPSRSKQP
jgi:hypothetical protein